MTKTFRDKCDINMKQWTRCELLFPDVWTQWKMYSFIPSVGPCMHHNYWCDFRKAYISPDCVRPTTLVAGLCTTCRGERVLVVIKFSVTFLPLTPYWKNVYLFLERCRVQQCMVARFAAVRLFILVLVLIIWTLQPYFTLWLSARMLQC